MHAGLELPPGTDDNRPPCRARPTTASPPRTTRRLRRRAQQGRRCYRFGRRRRRRRRRRRSSGRGVRGACASALTGLLEQAAVRGGASSKRQSTARFDAAAPGRRQGDAPIRGAIASLQTDSDLGPTTGIARDCFRTQAATTSWRRALMHARGRNIVSSPMWSRACSSPHNRQPDDGAAADLPRQASGVPDRPFARCRLESDGRSTTRRWGCRKTMSRISSSRPPRRPRLLRASPGEQPARDP